MTDVNPYSTPTTFASEPASVLQPTTKRLWIAYGIAPLVAPLISAVTVFVTGMVYLANHPEDTGTPIGVILVPIALLIAGVPASYAVAGLVGMPIAFWLRKRNRLNGYTVHGVALLLAAMLALVIAIGNALSARSEAIAFGLLDFLQTMLAVFAAISPFILLSATAFWLIGVRWWKHSMCEREDPQ
jgi:hypothetical protein